MSTHRSTSRILAGATLAASALFAATGMAATVTSGLVWYGDVAMPAPQNCSGAWLKADTSDCCSNQVRNGGNVQARECIAGGFPKLLPAGWIGIDTGGYRDGGFCGSYWAYTDSESSAISNTAVLCSNPAGNQTFTTDVFGFWWNGSAYAMRGPQFSPNLVR